MNKKILLAIVLVAIASGEQCIPDKRNPCITHCNGTTFDISNLFDYPYNISDDEYTWSPCKGYICPYYSTPGQLAAVCQTRDFTVNCGLYQNPIFILEQTDPYMFSIEYPSGSDWRISIFQFIVSKEYPKPAVTFTGEYPMLQYNFQVTGRCLGQPYCSLSGPNPFH